ncbi:TlpA family protein disulfide reductase [Autumnicola musiva]|uniref:TlpA disulfide reductase family protein n=1 Tax=Autumnicola musiva TaxID=3075589 RepID=A0ABU3DA39_9FLAO|nr:TlpA disulfide reductase family protein [Zunongwangia sp. F117]MDT0678404.1 TlpA disulfide reductase family protein [Zunongwangia sp. F117]
MKAKLSILSVLIAFFSLTDLTAQNPAYDPALSPEVPENIEKWMDAELAKVKQEPIQDYESDRFFSKEPAKLIGYIKGYDRKAGFDTGIYYASNQLTREDYPVTIEIQPDGRFEAEIPLIHPITSYLNFNNKSLNFYLEPGQTLGIVLDWEKFLEAERHNSRYYPQDAVVFKGKLARINEEITGLNFSPFNYSDFKENTLSLYFEDLRKLALDEKKENERLIAKYISENKLLEKTKILLTNKKELITATRILNYIMYKKDFQRSYPDNEILKEKIEPEHYSFLKDLPLNDQSLLVDRDFGQFINRFEYADPIKFVANQKRFNPEISLLEYFDLQKIPLTEEEINLYKPHSFESTATDEIKKFEEKIKPVNEKYSEEIQAYRNKYVNPYIEEYESIDFMEPWHKKDSVMVNHLHLENDLAYDITKVRSLKFTMGRITDADVANQFWSELSATIDNGFLIEEGNRIIQKKFPKLNAKPDNANTHTIAIKSETISLPSGKAKDLFYEIVDQYQGKILFIDFWATTCGPCIATIKRMKETRKKYENNPDFEFVFITDEALSPINSYNNFVKKQEMKNLHRVTTDIYNRFRQLFQFNGIPRYVVLNKQGELIDGDFPMNNFNYELPRILEKHK